MCNLNLFCKSKNNKKWHHSRKTSYIMLAISFEWVRWPQFFFVFLLFAYHKLQTWKVSANSYVANNYCGITLRSKFFGQKLRLNKFLWNWKIELVKNAEYDSAWSADHEKLYLSPSKNQFLRSKFFGQKLRLKKLLWNWKIELAKNAEYDSAWCANHEKL